MAKKGQGSLYTDKIAEEICTRISDGQPLRAICRAEGMPSWRTVYNWISENAEFAARIAHARELGFDAIAEECLDIADDTSRDTRVIGRDDGDDRETANTEWISRSKLRVETRLKLLAKWCPKRYGEKIQQEITGKDGGPVVIAGAPTDADL
jgi:hypothetical protein